MRRCPVSPPRSGEDVIVETILACDVADFKGGKEGVRGCGIVDIETVYSEGVAIVVATWWWVGRGVINEAFGGYGDADICGCQLGTAVSLFQACHADLIAEGRVRNALELGLAI